MTVLYTIRLLFTPLIFSSLALLSPWLSAQPANFERAKIELREKVYADRHTAGTLYCGCPWEWTGRSGGRIDLKACAYEVRAQETRAARIEWEHIMPASNFGRARQCWQDGGRSHCKATDPAFNVMEADMHNLSPAVGEINADRSNFNFSLLPLTPHRHGACDFKVDFSERAAEPRDAIKGQIARTYFYMHDRYNLPMSRQQEQLFLAWHRQFPVSEWEKERNARIAPLMGHGNPFVTGEREWHPGYRAVGDGVMSPLPANSNASGPIRANQRSGVYHLPTGCPGYQQMSPANIVEFASAEDAETAGFRRAGNCR